MPPGLPTYIFFVALKQWPNTGDKISNIDDNFSIHLGVKRKHTKVRFFFCEIYFRNLSTEPYFISGRWNGIDETEWDALFNIHSCP